MKVLATVEAKKGQTQRFEKKSIASKQMELHSDQKPKWSVNYGFIQNTYQQDANELDVFILGKASEIGATIEVIPVALIRFKDRGKTDDKIVATPATQKYVNKFFLKLFMIKQLRMIKKTKPEAEIVEVIYDKKVIESTIYLSKALYEVLIKRR